MEFTSNNTMYQVIGVNLFKFRSDSLDHGYHWMDKYTIYLSKIEHYGSDSYTDRFMFQAWTDYTDCSSGYCSATIGNCSEPVIVDSDQPIGTLHFVPKIPISVYHTQCDGEDNFIDEKWVTESGIPMFTISYNGGDSYYPAGYVSFNTDLFTKTIRSLSVVKQPSLSTESISYPKRSDDNEISDIGRQLYVFYGPSCVGKSFLGARLNELCVYETDQTDELPNNIVDYHVIVVGNRVKNHLAKVKEALKNIGSDVEVIWMGFSRECPI